ncbi:plasmid replication initiator RepA, partial [Pseudooceanicola lipolyticus]
ARQLMPGRDVHALEAEWRGVWARTGAQRLRKPDAAFLGWVKKRAGD